jgi:MoaA/NifB/PqqE/SkfB family radical SAM enzyme
VEDWYNIIDILHDWGLRHLTIYGGEPTLRPDLPDLLKHCLRRRILTHLVTNGRLLTEEYLSDLTYDYFLLGVSIDNLVPTPSSKKVYDENLVRLLKEHKAKSPNKIGYCVNVIITKENIHNLVHTIRKINENLDTAFSIDPVHSATLPNQPYLYRDYCPELILSKKQLEWLAHCISVIRQNGFRIWGTNRYYSTLTDWFSGSYNWRCDAGDLYFSVNNDGTMMVCEEALTKDKIWDLESVSPKERRARIQKYIPPGCQCVKPCYFMPTDLVNHPLKQFLP